MIEKSIEANIISAIQALNLTDLTVSGAWQAENEGEVKGTEESSPAALAVAVAPRSFETFGFGICSMEVAIALTVRTDLCPTGAALETYVDPVANLLQTWNLTMDCAHPCGMAVEGKFEPGGLQMSGGSGPDLDSEAGVWSITFNLTLRGTLLDAPTETATQEGD